MDYGRIYREFIADRRAREPFLQGYTERHHILPRSLGGGNDAENLIRLTPEDHFFAHLLLAKIHGGKMWYALQRMSKPTYRAPRPDFTLRAAYAMARRKSAEVMRGNLHSLGKNCGTESGRHNPVTFNWVNLDTGERKRATMYHMHRQHGGHRAYWTNVSCGYKKSAYGWAIEGKYSIRGLKGKKFSYVGPCGATFFGTQSQFAEHIGISKAGACRVTRRGAVTVTGWRLAA